MPADSQIALSGVHKTAFMAATLRAGHYLHAEEPKIFEDSYAHRLLEMTEDEIKAFNARIPGHLLSTCPLRSRFTEDRLAAATGRLNQFVSPRTARSQVHGGVVWAFSAALREAAEVDPRYGGTLNHDFADYIIPVNADIGEIEVDFINQPDPLSNAVGVKGLGEVAMVGASAAIANAVFHATGKRLRELPIRIEHLL